MDKSQEPKICPLRKRTASKSSNTLPTSESHAKQSDAPTGDSPFDTSQARELHLPDLPDVPALSIFSLLPLQQLIVDFPLFHRRFTPIRESVLKINQRLSLSIGDHRMIQDLKYMSPLRLPFAGQVVDSTGALLNPETDFYQLNLTTLDYEGVNQLSTLMPGIVYLEVAMANVNISVIQQLITLLTHWAPSLNTFKLITGNFYSADEPTLKWAPFSDIANHLRQLLTAISDNLLSLEHLSLNVKDSFDLPLEAIALDLDQAIRDAEESLNPNTDIFLPAADIKLRQAMGEAAEVLSQPLEMANDLTEQLPQARNLFDQLLNRPLNFIKLFKSNAPTGGGDGDLSLDLSVIGRLREFNFAIVNVPSMQAFLLDALQMHASEKLESIAIGGNRSTLNFAPFTRHRLASHFTIVPLCNALEIVHLTNLLVCKFTWKQDDHEMVSYLRALSSLTRMKCLKCHYLPGTVSPRLRESYLELPSLASVSVLEITLPHLNIENHDTLVAPYWEHLFPSVQIVQVIHSGIFGNSNSDCHSNIDGLYETAEKYKQMTPCFKRLFAPLRVLPNLRRIFFQESFNYQIGSEFTPDGTFVQTHRYIC